MDTNDNFETLKTFFSNDIKIKKELFKLAPTEMDNYNEESKIEYIDKLDKSMKYLEDLFNDISENFGYSDIIKSHFDKYKENLKKISYKDLDCRKIYQEQFSNMDPKLIEEVKKGFVGYYLNSADPRKFLEKATTINELLHVMHSYITNNEQILSTMPLINSKEIDNGENVNLYGEETQISKKIFEEFPKDLDCGTTDIVSMKNRVLMMVRDRGHALTIDMDIDKDNNTLVSYFVPKLCNVRMIQKLEGINKITENGANGMFQVTDQDLCEKLFGFISKVPTDADMNFENQNEKSLKDNIQFEEPIVRTESEVKSYSKKDMLLSKFNKTIEKIKNKDKAKEESKDDVDREQ